jgi:hypothetical protein
MFNIIFSFQFVKITFIYFPYLFLIRSLGPPYIQINAMVRTTSDLEVLIRMER